MLRKPLKIINIISLTMIILFGFQISLYQNSQFNKMNISNIRCSENNSYHKETWEAVFNTSGDDWAYNLAFDSHNSIYLVGYTENAGVFNILTLKFSPDGIEQWGRSWNSFNNDYGIGIVIDSADNIYVVGIVETHDENMGNIYLLKYNIYGDLLTSKVLNSDGDKLPSNIAIDSLNNIYITGYRIISESEKDIFLLKYNNFGDLQWEKYWDRNNIDIGYDIAIDPSNNIYITGSSINLSSESSKICLIKYSSQGIQLWNKTWSKLGKNRGQGIVIDSKDNIYVFKEFVKIFYPF